MYNGPLGKSSVILISMYDLLLGTRIENWCWRCLEECDGDEKNQKLRSTISLQSKRNRRAKGPLRALLSKFEMTFFDICPDLA